jgi:hypothetical protein
MAMLSISVNNSFSLHVTVRESDKHTQAVYVKIENYVSEDMVRGVSDMFMTPSQLDELGRFYIREAENIKREQFYRNLSIRE